MNRKYFVVDGMSGGFRDTHETFDTLPEALKFYIECGYANNPDCGKLSMVTIRGRTQTKKELIGSFCDWRKQNEKL